MEKKGLTDHIKQTIKHNKQVFYTKKKHVKSLGAILFIVKLKELIRIGASQKTFIDLFQAYNIDSFTLDVDIYNSEAMKNKDYQRAAFERRQN